MVTVLGAIGGVGSGIFASDLGSGNNVVSTNGAVSGVTYGIDAVNLNGGSVTGGTVGVRGDAFSQYLSVAGLLSGGMVGGTAADLSDGDDRLLLTSGAAVTGNLDGGADSDEALLEGTGVFDESFLNFESLTMQGVDWDLGGDSSFGSVAVDAGLLRVNGQVTTPLVTVANGGILGGDGTVVGSALNSGTVAPGNSIGVLTIDGDFTQTSDGRLEVEIDSMGNLDQLVVTGTAQLAGTLALIAEPGLLDVVGSVVLQGGIVEGEFEFVEDEGVMAEVVYEPDRVLLDVMSVPDGVAVAAPMTTALTGGFLFMENNGGGSREGGGGSGSASLRDGQLASLTPLRPVLADDDAEVWARGYGLWGDRDTSGGINGYSFNIQGLAGGFELPVATGWTVGASVGFADSETDKDGGAGEDEAQAVQLGLRADYRNEGFFFNLGLSGALVDYDLERVVGVGGVPTSGRAETEGYTLGARVEAGQAYDLGGNLTLRPMGSLAYMSATRDGYQEQGLGIFNLTVGDETAQAVRAAAELSLAHEASFASDGQSFRFTHEYRVGVTHEEALDDRQVGAVGLGAPLTLQGDDDARTLVTFGAGLSFKLSENAAIFAGYDGELGSDYNTHSINGGFRINW